MQLTNILPKAAAMLVAALFAVAVAGCSEPSSEDSSDAATSSFVGTYKTLDTQGGPMEITISEDGSASGKRGDETLDGSWKEENDAVVITWGDNWTTKIAKDGDTYQKSTWNGPMEGEPAHITTAEKVS